MASTVLGTGVDRGASAVGGPALPNAANYVIERIVEGDKEIDEERVMDADGALYAIVQYNILEIMTYTLIPKDAGAPETDFVKGTLIATDWLITDMSVDKTKSPHRISLTVLHVGDSAGWA